MFRQNKSRSKTSRNRSKNSIESNNLALLISNGTSTKCSTGKLKHVFSKISLATSAKNHQPHIISKEAQLTTRAPKNAAVHFGKFYGVQNTNVGKVYCDQRNNCVDTAIKKSRRLEFTRQMVHNLERIIDAEDYARQVSILLKETVEPANFKLNLFLSDTSIPNRSRRCSDYPLWYKEPYKMPLVFSNPIAQLDA